MLAFESKEFVPKTIQCEERHFDFDFYNYVTCARNILDASSGAILLFNNRDNSLISITKVGGFESENGYFKTISGKKVINLAFFNTTRPYIYKTSQNNPLHVYIRNKSMTSEMVIPIRLENEKTALIIFCFEQRWHGIANDPLNRIQSLLYKLSFNFCCMEFYKLLEEQRGDTDFMWNDDYFEEIFPLLKSMSMTDEPILLIGETGVGKELLSRFIHFLSKRNNKLFYPINCSSFHSDDLIASELFGHAKGAFTGAWKNYQGIFKSTDGGTIFLDEIQSSSLKFQQALLRFIEMKEIHPLGTEKIARADVRVISACSSLPDKLMVEKKFLPELYYRLASFIVRIPPLRDRKFLDNYIFYYLNKATQKLNKEIKGISNDALDCLRSYNWPGNIRELKAVIYKAVLLSKNTKIIKADFPQEIVNHNNNTAVEISCVGVVESSSVVDDLLSRMKNGQNFWEVVKEPFLRRDLTRNQVQELIKAGLKMTKGKYKGLLRLFALNEAEYDRFMSFLKNHKLKP